MKRMLFFIFLLGLIIMTGCGKNENAEISTLPNNENYQQQEIANNDTDRQVIINNVSNKKLGERTQAVKDYLEEFKNTYGELNYIDGDRFIANGRLVKSGDYYTMTFSFVSPRLYDKEVIDKALQEAQNNGTYEFENYTFYKDFDSFMETFESDGYKEIINEFAETEKDSIFVTSKNKMAYIIKPTPNNQSKFVLVSVGLPNGLVDVIDDDKKIDVVLFADDSIIIDNQDYNLNHSGDGFQNKLTVEEYYNKAINGEKILIGYNQGDEYYYEFNNNDIGSSKGYAGLKNAVELEENSIIIKLPVQGGI